MGLLEQQSTARPTNGPDLDAPLDLTGVALAGAGAVGTAWMHTLWATEAVRGQIPVADSDAQGVTLTNLNRGVLFTRSDLREPKATTAATACAGPIDWRPAATRFEDLEVTPIILVSAVDTNTSRAALQARYPARLLSGSTKDLRAEVLICGPPGQGACLRCYNEPEHEMPDAEVRARALADGGEPLLAELAAGEGVTVDVMRDLLAAGECSEMSERALRQLRAEFGVTVPAFAVGFTSVAAGTLLAVETLRTALGLDRPVDGGPFAANDVLMQFRRPNAVVNGPTLLGRDTACPACAPGPRVDLWGERYSAFSVAALPI